MSLVSSPLQSLGRIVKCHVFHTHSIYFSALPRRHGRIWIDRGQVDVTDVWIILVVVEELFPSCELVHLLIIEPAGIVGQMQLEAPSDIRPAGIFASEEGIATTRTVCPFVGADVVDVAHDREVNWSIGISAVVQRQFGWCEQLFIRLRAKRDDLCVSMRALFWREPLCSPASRYSIAGISLCNPKWDLQPRIDPPLRLRAAQRMTT